MRKVYSFLLLAAGLAICSNLMAQRGIYMKVAGVDGGVTVKGFEKTIEALSYSYGAASCSSLSAFKDGTCKISSSGFNFMTALDPAITPLRKLLFTGKLIPSTTVSLVKTGNGGEPFVYYIIRLENIYIGSLQESSSSEGPTFSIEFIPQKLSWAQFAQKPDGSVEKIASFGWDLVKQIEFTPTF